MFKLMFVQIFKRIKAKVKEEFMTQNYLNLITCLEIQGETIHKEGGPDTSKFGVSCTMSVL